MPEATSQILSKAINDGHIAIATSTLEHALMAHIRRMSEADFCSLPWLSEGIENRLYRISRTAATYNELLEETKTRRYSMARLRRILWAALLGITGDDVGNLPPYIRVLGMNQRGREILNVANPTLPILTRTAQLRDMSTHSKRIFDIECAATDLHALCMTHPLPCGNDHTNKIIVK